MHENQMEIIKVNQEMLQFIESAASMYHTIAVMAEELEENGFQELRENDRWYLETYGKYYVKRNNSSLIAFTIGDISKHLYFKIAASHSDSPTFAIKDIPEIIGPEEYVKLNVEAYGGMIDYSWFDRPLGVAGRVLVRMRDALGKEWIENRLLHIEKDILMIPSLCVHFNREVNKGMEFNRQADLCPLFSAGALKKGGFEQMIADCIGVEPEDVLGKNLFLVNHQKGVIWGEREEFVSSAKLDDLQCAFTSLKGFLSASSNMDGEYSGINVLACFDNEEVGSNTKQGAMSTFLPDTLKRICLCLDKSEEDYYRAAAASFLISADNAHAQHPNHPEKSDAQNVPHMNKGIVIKENASQKYVTDAVSRSILKAICERADIPYQSFANRSNVAGGSTLGNLSNTQFSVHAVDIGLAQLAMHSAYETAGTADTCYAMRLFDAFYQTDLQIEGSDCIHL